MSRTQKIVHTYRANKGSINDFIDEVWTLYKAHGRESFGMAFSEAAANRVIARYETKIRNGFSRAGFELPAGELTQETMLGFVRETTGLDMDSLNPEAVTMAVDRLLAARLSQALGVQVTTVLDKDAMLASMNAAVLQAIRDGRAAEFVNKQAMRAARQYMTFKRRGIEPEAKDRVANRRRQKRYRSKNRLVWDK